MSGILSVEIIRKNSSEFNGTNSMVNKEIVDAIPCMIANISKYVLKCIPSTIYRMTFIISKMHGAYMNYSIVISTAIKMDDSNINHKNVSVIQYHYSD